MQHAFCQLTLPQAKLWLTLLQWLVLNKENCPSREKATIKKCKNSFQFWSAKSISGKNQVSYEHELVKSIEIKPEMLL